jgi:hypothetical protein
MSYEIKGLFTLAKRVKAGAAKLFALEYYDVCLVVTENATGIEASYDDFVILARDLNGCLVVDVKVLAKLLGKDKTSKLVNVSYDSCGFHGGIPFFFDKI